MPRFSGKLEVVCPILPPADLAAEQLVWYKGIVCGPRETRPFGGDKVVVTAGGEERVAAFQPGNRFARQMEHFSDCILTGAPLLRPPVDALHNTAALVALKRSAETGQAVAL